jgi:lipopolysaccharide/colanic/teichoic acid biosynthesis glycosyltransferase
MVAHIPQRTVAGRSVLQRQRAQLGGALVLAVILPFLIRINYPILGTERDFVFAVAGNVFALIFGHYILRSLTVYPGIVAGFYVLPAFFISYSLVLIAFWAFRLDYSRFLFLSGFVICVLWYFFVSLWLQRTRSLRIGVVPFGRVDALSDVEGATWTTLSRPEPKSLRSFDAIVADFGSALPDEWERFLADCALKGIIVYHCKQLQESLTGRVAVDHLSENTFGSLIPALVYVKLKRMIDFTFALAAAIVLTPLFLGAAIAIKLDSRGPVLFRQRRVGAGGVPFRVVKFRTMANESGGEASNEIERAITVEDDPRITRVGRFLRRTRIDELPQIFNILAGEMSWIGPRPEAEILSKWYEAELPFYRYRHVVKPGITGWAQVNQGHVAEMHQVHGKLQYDFYYIKYFSPWLDVLIMFRTVVTVVTGHGFR